MNSFGNNTKKLIDSYLMLPIGSGPSCPYFNNRRRKNHGGLRVLKGKGTPTEIVEECKIFSKLDHTDIVKLSREELKEYLIKKDLGIDCSGFAYHVLDSHSNEITKKSLSSQLKSIRGGILGKIIFRLRPAENFGVSSFRDESNSHEIKLSEVKAGDIITCIGTGKENTYNHILVISTVEKIGIKIKITYVHSYAWPSDGKYGHGVREGTILVNESNILQGIWTEKNETTNTNYTFESMKTAKEVSIRRLNCFS